LHYKEGRGSGKNTDIVERFSLKLFRFGLLMFFFAFLFGGWLWFKFGIGGTWLNVKLGLVTLLFFYFIFSGWLFLCAVRQNKFPGDIVLRIFNESSLLLVIPIIYLAVSKSIS